MRSRRWPRRPRSLMSCSGGGKRAGIIHGRPPSATDADALKLLDEVADSLLALRPRARRRSASTPARGRRCGRSSPIAPRQGSSAWPSRCAPTSTARRPSTPAGLSHAARTSVEVVRSAYATALEGFALPYGDITVGGWRNTPYVVIQNVGAYLDIPRFLDSDHRIENAADAEAYLARLQSYAKQLDGELGTDPGGARGGPRAAGVPDRQGARADDAVGEERARGRLARRVDRAPDEEHSRRLGRRARARSPRRKSRRRSSGRSRAARRSAPSRRTTPASRRGRTARSSTAGRSRPRPRRRCRRTRSTRWARASWSGCTRRWTRS